MMRTSRMTQVVVMAAIALGGCGDASEQASLGGLPLDPMAAGAAADDGGSSAPSVDMREASAPESVEVQPTSVITPLARPANSLETPSRRDSASAPPVDAGSGSDGTGPDAQEPGAVGPAASYDDDAGDAHGGAGIGALSQSSFDILRVHWEPLPYEVRGRRGYSTSMTIAGPAREDGAYVSYGFFRSAATGEECELYNILELGTPAYAHAFCGSIADGTRRFLGRMNGRPVTSSPTAAGGATIVGTFDDPVVSHELEATGRTLYNLSAFAAMCSPGPHRCATLDEVWDWVSSTSSFRV